MKEQLISFETAKLAKEKGFNIATSHGYYRHGTEEDFRELLLWVNAEEKEPEFGFAPTQALLQKWLREIHSTYVTSLPSYSDNSDKKKHFFEIAFQNTIKQMGDKFGYFDTYEQALEVGLLEALKLLP